MPRAKNRVASKQRRKKIIKSVKGQFGRTKSTLKTAKQAADKAGTNAYRDRRRKKREFRSLWIIKINAACRQNGISYSMFIKGLLKSKVEIDRKILATIAEKDEKAFSKIVEIAKKAA
jgi:large subunit ribosomal protein L20